MTPPVALATVFVVYGLIASRLERSLITAPIFFVAAGLLLGPSVTGIVTAAPEQRDHARRHRTHARDPAVRRCRDRSTP